ncbi:MAG: hypothetical protein V4635_16195 [Bacteroidota bacterium]
MKKIALTIIALFTLSLSSCKKDYVCQCSKVRTSGGNTLTTEDGKYTFKDTRTRAESRCADQEKTDSDILGDYSRECEIQ